MLLFIYYKVAGRHMGTINYEEVFTILKSVYEENMPFNKLLGIKIEEMSLERVSVTLDMKENLVGNPEKKILHGGVISSILDFTGGVIVQVQIIKSMENASPEELKNRLLQMGTIDMRVDFIRPGRGEMFRATGNILRVGNKVAVARCLLHNEEDILIAAATTNYLVG
jgi:uncharacterized protein (TIGR00369 family)